jgi:hypothetical protein
MDAMVWAFSELMLTEGMGILDYMANQHTKIHGEEASNKRKTEIEKKLEELRNKMKKN